MDYTQPWTLPSRILISQMGNISFSTIHQIDRLALDMALYEKAVHAPLCTPLDTKATDVEYQPKEDKIAAVTLADETRLPTAFDFDATDQMRFLAKSLNLECTQLGESNRVVQAYFVADGDRQAGDRATQPGLRWLDELSIVRLFKEENEIEGFAIAIPIGNKVGVRVSAPIQNVQGTSDETLMEVAQQAFVQHGILYRDVFPTPISLNSEVNELYHYEQAFGANWLLAGMACYNTLLTAAISIDTSFITLFLPVQFMKNPKKIGGLYQRYIAHALQTTELYRWLASHEFPALPLAVRMKGTEYLWANVALFVRAYQLQHAASPLVRGLYGAERFVSNSMFHNFSKYLNPGTRYQN